MSHAKKRRVLPYDFMQLWGGGCSNIETVCGEASKVLTDTERDKVKQGQRDMTRLLSA